MKSLHNDTAAIVVTPVVESKKTITLTAGQAEEIVSLLGMMHSIVSTLPGLPAMAAFDGGGEAVWEETVVRAFKGATRFYKVQNEAKANAARGTIDSVLAKHKEAGLAALAQYNAIAPATRAALGLSAPEAIYVPVTEIVAAFNGTMTEGDCRKALKALGYTLAAGRSKDGNGRVKVSLLPPAPQVGVNPPVATVSANIAATCETTLPEATEPDASDSEDKALAAEIAAAE